MSSHLTADLTPEQDLAFQAWRADALSVMPYFARPLFSMRVLNAPGLGTFAVDGGYRLYIDFDAVMPLGAGYCSEALLHECSHLFAGHAAFAEDLGLRSAEQRKVWNVAGDCAINDDLQDAGCTHVPNPQVHMLPETIGAERNQTPHHYYGVLREMQSAAQRRKIQGAQSDAPTLTLTPSRLPEGRVAGQLITLTASAGFIDPADFTVLLTDAEGTTRPVTVQGANTTIVGVTLDADLPLGTYSVSLLSGGIAAGADLQVTSRSIAVEPKHVESTWSAPLTIKVTGDLTQFTPTARITLASIDSAGSTGGSGTPIAVANTRRLSHTEIRFDLTSKVPDGTYLVTVHDTETLPDGSRLPVECSALLPIGLPLLSIEPATLPTGYPAGTTIDAIASDFGFNAATTLVVLNTAGATEACTHRVMGLTHVEIDLATSLPEGTYLVLASNTSAFGTIEAAGAFIVRDQQQQGQQGDKGEDQNQQGEGEGEGEGEGQQGDQGEFKGCGSGAGGESAPCELDPTDDLNGTAPAASAMERENIRIATAAAVKDHAAKNPGSVPGGMLDTADLILAPSKTPWERVLGGFVRRSVASRPGATDIDRNRRSRRRHRAELRSEDGSSRGRIVYPGKYSPTPSIHVVRDTSGSMSKEDLAAVGREIVAIAKRLSISGEDLLVTDCDVEVHDPVPFRNPASIREVKGRGGTDMRVGINSVLEARGKKPAAIVVATDGYTEWPTERPRIPVIAVIMPQKGCDDVPQGVIDAVPDFIKVVVVVSGQDAIRRAAA
ncbi:DUF2201 family putative metallopeptidase [Nocardioides sp. Leaf285]|uniref:DUF2201 family putative metallopeptidase n=1 Tax=Nocardioides sp. Leaf285 TaxID=1736322 RepID=UPI0007025325|nr:VWA-like domain-containing protein [Nocardioides sp. Leaf285]KQP62820.1 hypothetical protein ASF47_17565 [Nocardioides sp. Leaf285]